MYKSTIAFFPSLRYRFSVLVHTTNVSFQIEAISSSQLTIRIDHNNTKTISSRICSGQVSQVDEQDQWITIQVRKGLNRIRLNIR